MAELIEQYLNQSRCIVIGEVAQAHDGSLGMAHAFIDAIACAGADAVKFQTHIAHAESTVSEAWRVRFSQQDETRYDYWKRMEFTEEQWAGLKRHAEQKGLLFLSSPFSLEAARLLSRLGIRAWKVASGEIGNVPLLEFIAQSKLPAIVSTGMSALAEIDRTVEFLQHEGVPVILLQTTSAYPCPPEKIGLNLVSFLKSRYCCPVGLSDHSGKIFPGLAGAVLGISALEVHVTLSREAFGPDVCASLTTSELRHMIEGIRYIEAMMSNPVDKDALAEDLAGMRTLFTKSIVAAEDLAPDTILAECHLAYKKPGTGIPPHQKHRLIGRKVRRFIAADQPVSEADLE